MNKTIKFILSIAAVICLTQTTTASAAVRDEEPAKSEVSVSYDSGRLVVKGLEEKTRIEVTNMLGVKVFNAVAANTDRNEFAINLRKGIYIVRVGQEVKRIAVR